MKVEELQTGTKKDRAFSISFDEDETIEIFAFKKNRINFMIKKKK